MAKYDHEILKPARVHELIELASKKGGATDGAGFLVGTSYGGGTVPKENVVRASDFLLLHGNGVKDPARIAEMVRQTRKVAGYRPMPILFNEDDHFDFDKPQNNFTSAVSEYASWGYFDYRMAGRRLRRRLPERARELGPQQRPQTRVLQAAERDHG